MTFSRLIAPNTPEWLLNTVAIVYVVLLIGLIGWSVVLEIRYTSPYKLIETSNHDKWRRAIILSLLQTSFIPILGLVTPIISPFPDQWSFIPICGGVWLVILPLAILLKRWEFEWHIRDYQRLDKMIKGKNSIFQRLFSNPLTRWIKILMTGDLNRFFSEGYPDINENKDRDFYGQQPNEILKNNETKDEM